MISNSLILGMFLAITICFFTPVVVLMWLLLKRHAKRMIYMLMFGVIARVGVLFVQTFITFCLDSVDGYQKMSKAVLFLVNDALYSVIVVCAIYVILTLIRNDGLTFNRVVTMSVGFSTLGMIAGTGLSYFTKITNVVDINNGSIYSKYGENGAQKIIDAITADTFLSCITDSYTTIAVMAVCSLCFVVVLYGMAKDKMRHAVSFTILCIFIQRFFTDSFVEYTNDVIVLLFDTLIIVSCLYVLVSIGKKEKEIMIKPRSMINKENQETEKRHIVIKQEEE